MPPRQRRAADAARRAGRAVAVGGLSGVQAGVGRQPTRTTPAPAAPRSEWPWNQGPPGAGSTGRSDEIDFNQGAFDLMRQLLAEYGLESLAGLLRNLIEDGITDQASLTLQLQETEEWKRRFAGNERLREQGLGVLSPGEYLALERAYANALRSAGLPPGFYDEPEDFAGFIGNNLSVQELAERANAATELARQVDPTQRDLLRSMYGISEGDIAAVFLDPDRALPLIQRQVTSVQMGSAARAAGVRFDAGDASRFERLQDAGVTAGQAAAGYQQIAQELDPLDRLSEIWTQRDWSLDDAEQATFMGNADTVRRRGSLVDRERAAFSGASGATGITQGSRRRDAGRF